MSRKMKDSCVPWVGDIPEKWSAQSVKNLVEPGKNGIKIGPFGSALKGKTLDAGPVKIYTQANLISEDFDVSRHFVSEETFKELSAYQVFPGDILFSMMGTIGKCCQMPANKQVGIMDSHLLKARLNSKILPEFFIYAFDKDRNPSTFDQLMLLSNQTKPYEVNKGESMALVEEWSDKISQMLIEGRGYTLEELDENLQKITKSFSKIELNKVPKVKVGIVGEIYVKYSKMANNGLEEFLAEQDCEVCVPGLMGFAAFKVDNRIEDIKMFGGNALKFKFCKMLLNYITKLEGLMVEAAKKYGFVPPHEYAHTKELVKGVIGYGSKMGEGWLLTAEMLELAETGYENIVCTQPFGCLPNHINGKGAIRKIKEIKPNANIVTIDYDPGAPKVNQENRIKLMLAVGKEQLEKRIANGEINTEN